MMPDTLAAAPARIGQVTVAAEPLRPLRPRHEVERVQAIADLQSELGFTPCDPRVAASARIVHVQIEPSRMVFDLRRDDEASVAAHMLSVGPFRAAIREYNLIVDSHEAAVMEGNAERIQAIDMGRRGLHDSGSALVAARLAGKIAVNHDAARRLFTLLCVLQRRD